MKKVYEKPQIMFESFSLSTNIAGDCEVKTNTPCAGTCPYTIEDKFGDTSSIFTSNVAGCDTTEVKTYDGNDGMYNNICYHVPIDQNVFNS